MAFVPLVPQVRGLNILPHPSVQTWQSTCIQLASLGVTTTVHASPLSHPKARDQGQALIVSYLGFPVSEDVVQLL